MSSLGIAIIIVGFGLSVLGGLNYKTPALWIYLTSVGMCFAFLGALAIAFES